MKKTKSYENFPLWIVFLSAILSLSIYTIGAYIMLGFGIFFVILYLLYCLWMEINVLRRSCVGCYYYGKVCGFGKGKLCSLFFKKGSSKIFVKRKISPIDILPDFLVFIIPTIGGVILSILNFNWTIVGAMIILLFISFAGNAFIRGSLACKYCKQREIGCPAEKLFSKKKK